MNGNRLKAVACLAMLVDHIGFLLFPHIPVLRWVGRLALPLFAYMVAEGCRHTRSRWRYFGRMCGLGLLCQLVYVAEGLFGGGVRLIYLNILLTFSVSMVLCFTWLDLVASLQEGERTAAVRRTVWFVLAVVGAAALNGACEAVSLYADVRVEFDYALPGMLLPLFALVGSSRVTRLCWFGVGLLLFCLALSGTMPYVWFALPALLLLWVYNGRRGDRRWQWVFYAFYPLHLAVLYGLAQLL